MLPDETILMYFLFLSKMHSGTKHWSTLYKKWVDYVASIGLDRYKAANDKIQEFDKKNNIKWRREMSSFNKELERQNGY